MMNVRTVRRVVIAVLAGVFGLGTIVQDTNAQVMRRGAARRLARQQAAETKTEPNRFVIKRRVLDQAEILLPEQEKDLELKIWKFDNETHIHVAILIAQQFNKEKVQQLFARLANKKRIAPEEKANSVLVIVFVAQRRGMIEVGENLQAKLPPLLRRQIIQQRIMRRFNAGQFYAGVNAGLMGIMTAVSPGFKPYENANVPGTVLTKPVLDEEPGDTTAPTITITEPAQTRGMKIESKDKIVVVKGKASDPNGIFEVSINGVEASLTPSGDFSAQLRLAVGDNNISVKAIDTRNNIAERSFTMTREAVEQAATEEASRTAKDSALNGEGKYYALVIGIDKYSGEWPTLTNAVHDASGVADELSREYKFDKITTLLDKEATRANIIRQMEWLTENVKKNDNVLIFYSGHGDYKKTLNKGFWVPVDAQSQSTVDFISNSDIQTFLGGIPSRHTFLIADACFSGDIFRGMEETVNKDDLQRYYTEVERRASRQAMSSGGLEPVMDGGRDGHSVFTYYLLQALKNNSSPNLDAGQLYDEIKIPVANNSDQTPIFNAIKNTGDEGGQFVFRRK
ncbi:MAG TPA: caspase family protein [Bacteroidota bacterium]